MKEIKKERECIKCEFFFTCEGSEVHPCLIFKERHEEKKDRKTP